MTLSNCQKKKISDGFDKALKQCDNEAIYKYARNNF